MLYIYIVSFRNDICIDTLTLKILQKKSQLKDTTTSSKRINKSEVQKKVEKIETNGFKESGLVQMNNRVKYLGNIYNIIY